MDVGSIRRSARELNDGGTSTMARRTGLAVKASLLCALGGTPDRTAFLGRHAAIVDPLIVRCLVAQPFFPGGGRSRGRRHGDSALELRVGLHGRSGDPDAEHGKYLLHRAALRTDLNARSL